MKKKKKGAFIKGMLSTAIAPLLLCGQAHATSSSVVWSSATASCQAWKVPHITYDAYFAKGPGAGGAGAPNYPIDTGLTVGVLPFEKLQAEVGFDLLLPTQDPYLLNGKLCTPESSLFAGSPGLSVGINNWGFSKNVNDYNIVYAVMQKTIPGIGGSIGLGVYRGMNETLFTNSDRQVVQSGLLASITAPDINLGLNGLKKIVLSVDAQTGKNAFGAWGIGASFYFTDTISLLTGPVFFNDANVQPGTRDSLWTLQLDIDIPTGEKTTQP